MNSRLVNIDTTRNSIIHWYYTSWALTYLTFLNYLPIIAQYFTQRGFCMNSDYFPRIPLSQQVSCSSLKRVRWSVTKTPTLCLKSIELAALREPHQAEGPCLSLRKSYSFCFLILSLFKLPHCLQFSSLFVKKNCVLLFHNFRTGFIVCTWEERQNEEKAKPKTKSNKTQDNHQYIILVLS